MEQIRESVFERAIPGLRKANKRHILDCALACFDELGLEATTIDVIRQRSQSSIGTIYHHFGNMEGLVAAIFLAALDDLQAHIGPAMEAAPDLRGAIEAMVRSYLAWVTEQPTLARFMFQARSLVASGEHKSELETRNKQRYGALIKRLAEAMENGVIRPLPKETYASLLIGQSENYCRAWLSGRVKGAPAEQAEVFAQAAWRAVASEA